MTPDDPRHGKRSGYLAGCGNDCCRIANARWTKQYRHAASRNGGRTTVPAEPIRQHVLQLQKTMSLTSIGTASGTSSPQLSRLIRGQHTRMWRKTAAALLAVRPDSHVGGHYVLAVGAQRRIQALAALGYSFEHLDKHLGGYGRGNISHIAYGRRTWITSDIAVRVKAAFDELAMQLPPATTRSYRSGVTRTQNRAKALGWAPPLAWDDETIDDPSAKPVGLTGRYIVGDYIDEAAVLRRMAGDMVTLTRAERIEVVTRLRAAQWTYSRIEHHTGLKTDRYIARQKAAA